MTPAFLYFLSTEQRIFDVFLFIFFILDYSLDSMEHLKYRFYPLCLDLENLSEYLQLTYVFIISNKKYSTQNIFPFISKYFPSIAMIYFLYNLE